MNFMGLYDIFLQHPSIQTDTRKLQAGDVYFALKGPNFDGNAFAVKALKDGAAFAVVDDVSLRGVEQCILVEDVLLALQHLALHHRRQFKIPVLAITGSNGKTTTKELVHAALASKYNTIATIGNLNNHIGVPLTLLRLSSDTEMAIIEMGANHLLEIASYCEIAEPTHGLITNCGKAHLEGFGSEEGIRKGKGELYDFLRKNDGLIFRYSDAFYLQGMAEGIKQQLTYGSSAKDDYTGLAISSSTFLQVVASHKDETVELNTHLVGNFNLPNVMAAVAIGLHFGVDLTDIKIAIEQYQPDNSRSQWMQKGSNNLILDAYNANPTSMQAAIENFGASSLHNKQLWIGAMKEMGADETKEHTALINLIRSYSWMEVLLVGKEFDNLGVEYKHFQNSQEAKSYIASNAPQGAHILIKGSRGSRMEEIVQALPS